MKRRLYGLTIWIIIALCLLSGCAAPLDSSEMSLTTEGIETIIETESTSESTSETESTSESESESTSGPELTSEPVSTSESESQIDENGFYYSAEDVAAYLRTFGELPPNYITKEEAAELGWDSSKGNLWEVAEGYVIGGNRFGNREGLLPEAKGRKWFECDVDYEGGFRDKRRLVYSNDGLIYFTDDHYKSFEDWSETK